MNNMKTPERETIISANDEIWFDYRIIVRIDQFEEMGQLPEIQF